MIVNFLIAVSLVLLPLYAIYWLLTFMTKEFDDSFFLWHKKQYYKIKNLPLIKWLRK